MTMMMMTMMMMMMMKVTRTNNDIRMLHLESTAAVAFKQIRRCAIFKSNVSILQPTRKSLHSST